MGKKEISLASTRKGAKREREGKKIRGDLASVSLIKRCGDQWGTSKINLGPLVVSSLEDSPWEKKGRSGRVERAEGQLLFQRIVQSCSKDRGPSSSNSFGETK